MENVQRQLTFLTPVKVHVLGLRLVGKINTIPTSPNHKTKSLDMSMCGVEVADKLVPLAVGPIWYTPSFSTHSMRLAAQVFRFPRVR